MPTCARIEAGSNIYHLTNRGKYGKKIFFGVNYRKKFINILQDLLWEENPNNPKFKLKWKKRKIKEANIIRSQFVKDILSDKFREKSQENQSDNSGNQHDNKENLPRSHTTEIHGYIPNNNINSRQNGQRENSKGRDCSETESEEITWSEIYGISEEEFDDRKWLMEQKVREVIEQPVPTSFHLLIYAFCLMDNHFHLLIYCKDKQTLSDFMQSLKLRYIRYVQKHKPEVFNDSDGKPLKDGEEKLFGGRFKSEAIEHRPMDMIKYNRSRFWITFRYILRNPIEAGKTFNYDYEWSSYNAYFSKDIMPWIQKIEVQAIYKDEKDFDRYLYEFIGYFRPNGGDLYQGHNSQGLNQSNQYRDKSTQSNKRYSSEYKTIRRIRGYIRGKYMGDSQKSKEIKDLARKKRIEAAVEVCRKSSLYKKKHIAKALCIARCTLYRHLSKETG